MVKVTEDELRKLMYLKHNIRNPCVIGHNGHGKSTLIDSLVATAGSNTQEVPGSVRALDTTTNERERMTIKPSGISLSYEMSDEAPKGYEGERQENVYLINLIDTPGHLDFSFEVTAALRVSDGALVVVDCIKGVCLQTETVLRQAIEERIQPVITLNRMDTFFLDRDLDGENAYLTLQKHIQDVNCILDGSRIGDIQVYPDKGTIAFSSGLHGWAFTLQYFAKLYASRLGVDESKMMERLWGENFIDFATKEWTTRNNGSRTCHRGFVALVYQPIKKIINLCKNDQKDKLWGYLAKFNVTMKPEEKKLVGRALIQRVMQVWLPSNNAVLELIIRKLPSPAKAQQYRAEYLYEGLLDDHYANAIRDCDCNGPLMLYVSKMIPAAAAQGKFYAFGRVFAGKVATGMNVRIMGPAHSHGDKKDLKCIHVQRTVVWKGKKPQAIEDVPCGNTVAILGLDGYITKTATLTNEKEVDAHPIRAMNFFVSPIVYVAVSCKGSSNHSKLSRGLELLKKSDPLVVTYKVDDPREKIFGDSSELIIGVAGEMHLRACLKELQENFIQGMEITWSHPRVSFRETVVDTQIAIAKSDDKHTTIYMVVTPLQAKLCKAIDQMRMHPNDDSSVLSRILLEEFGWDKDLTKKIWCFRSEEMSPNILVDMCKGVQHSKDFQKAVVKGFEAALKKGALAKENIRGVCLELWDVVRPYDAPKDRGFDLIDSTAVTRAIHAAQLTAKPRLIEPIYLMEIYTPEKGLHGVVDIVKQRRGEVCEVKAVRNTSFLKINAYLPVIESFGFAAALGTATSGEAIPHCKFDRWQLMPCDPLEVGSKAALIVSQIRSRKKYSL